MFLFYSLDVTFTQELGGSPGLVVMGGDSCSEGRGFKSQYHILDGHNIFYKYLL